MEPILDHPLLLPPIGAISNSSLDIPTISSSTSDLTPSNDATSTETTPVRAGQSCRPDLTSTPTLRRAPSLHPFPSSTSPRGTKQLVFSSAPHLLVPTASSALASLPASDLVQLVIALSRQLATSERDLTRTKQRVEMLETLAKANGVGEGEWERWNLRIHLDDDAAAGTEQDAQEWSIEIEDDRGALEQGDEDETDRGRDTIRRRRKGSDLEEDAERAKAESTSMVDNLNDAISDEAFAFFSPTVRPLEEDGLFSDSDSISRLAITSSPPLSYRPVRVRHPSLSSRIFGTASSSSLSSAPIAKTPLASTSSQSSRSPARVVAATRQSRSDSTSSSIASSSKSILDESVDPEAKNVRASTYGDWIGWKSWRKGGGSISSSTQGGKSEEIADASTPTSSSTLVSESTATVLPSHRRRSRGQSNATTSSSFSSPFSLTPTTTTTNTSSTSPTLSPLAPPQFPGSSYSTSSSAASSVKNVSPTISRRTGAPSSLYISPTTPSLVLPCLSTPIPTSIISPAVSALEQLPTTSTDAANETEPQNKKKKKVPSHYRAITRSASDHESGVKLSDIFVQREEKIGTRIKFLVNSLFSNISRPYPSPAFATALPLPLPKSRPSVKLGKALGLGASASASLAATMKRTVEPNLTLLPTLSGLFHYAATATMPMTSSSVPIHAMPTGMGIGSGRTMELETMFRTTRNGMHSSDEAKVAKDGDEDPMVDRYGFVVDIQSGMKLLRRKFPRTTSSPPPSSPMSSTIEVASVDAADDGTKGRETTEEVERELEELRETLGLPPTTSPVVLTSPLPTSQRLARTTSSNFITAAAMSRPLTERSISASSSTTLPPLLSSASSSTLKSDTVSATTGAGAAKSSMKLLLQQLTAMQDKVEATRTAEWEKFIQKRQAQLQQQTTASLHHHQQYQSTKSTSQRQSRNSIFVSVDERRGEDEEDDAILNDNDNLIGVARMGNLVASSTSTGMNGKGSKRRATTSSGGMEEWNEFKELVRKGVPIMYRAKIWAECSGATEIREPGVYQELLQRHEGETNDCLNQIDLDCHRTFPTNVFFAGNGPGVNKLRNVLIAYSWRNPNIGYCQGMNNLTATLLLTHPSEEDAFWVLVSLIEKILPEDYYTSHLLVSQADQRVLRDLIQSYLPDVANHLHELGVELPAITFGWFLSLFTDSLPIQTLLRIWDILFVFGTITLFRVAIAIISINRAEILACDSATSVYPLMRTMTTHLYQVDKLLKIACEDLRSVVKDREITKLRDHYVAELREEMGIPSIEADDER